MFILRLLGPKGLQISCFLELPDVCVEVFYRVIITLGQSSRHIIVDYKATRKRINS